MIERDTKRMRDALEFWGQVELLNQEIRLDRLGEFIEDGQGRFVARVAFDDFEEDDVAVRDLAERYARSEGWDPDNERKFPLDFAYRLCIGSLPVSLVAKRLVDNSWNENVRELFEGEWMRADRVPLLEIFHDGCEVRVAAPTFSTWLYAQKENDSRCDPSAFRGAYDDCCQACMDDLATLSNGALSMGRIAAWTKRSIVRLLNEDARKRWGGSECDFNSCCLVFRLSSDGEKGLLPRVWESYFLNDIDWLVRECSDDGKFSRNAGGDQGAFGLLRSYVNAGFLDDEGSRKRIDLFSRAADKSELADWYEAMLLDGRTPAGRWPSGYRPSLMQQIAVNTIAGNACGTHCDEPGIDWGFGSAVGNLFSVSGPPGTGKTTLLEDVVAAFVVERAFLLSAYEKPDDAFDDGHCEDGGSAQVYRLLDERVNDFGILVCSSSNASVENISKGITRVHELTKSLTSGEAMKEERRTIDRLNYFNGAAKSQFRISSRKVAQIDRDMEERLLLSARLGNSKNVRSFCRALRDVVDEMIECPTPRFRVARRAFRDQYALVHRLMKAHENDARKSIQAALRIQLDELMGDDEAMRTKAHMRNEASSDGIDRARDELFIRALEFMREFVLSSRKLKSNYKSLYGLLCKKEFADVRLESYTAELIQSLFLLTPVISSTFASMGRLFRDVRPRRGDAIAPFGLLVMDEAGLASPQMAVGSLARCRRAVAIGDRKQVSPIVESDLQILNDIWGGILGSVFTSVKSSVQLFADRQNAIGSSFDKADADEWCGCPLFVHRRCQSPIYDIFNTVVYDGRMVKGVLETDCVLDEGGKASSCCLPASRWINVAGAEEEGRKNRYVPGQGDKALELIKGAIDASSAHEVLSRIFVISPFRTVVEGFRGSLKNAAMSNGWLNTDDLERFCENRVGTVHAFQGKETDEVIFLLGCDAKSMGSVGWVGDEIVGVAASRARKRLYVIGDIEVWKDNPSVSRMKEILDFQWVADYEAMLETGDCRSARDRLLACVPGAESFSKKDGFVYVPELPGEVRRRVETLFRRVGCGSSLWRNEEGRRCFEAVLGDDFKTFDGLVMQGFCLCSALDGVDRERLKALRVSDDMSAFLLPFCKAAELLLRLGYFECLKKANPDYRLNEGSLKEMDSDKVSIGAIRKATAANRMLLGELTKDACDDRWWVGFARTVDRFGKVRNKVCHGSRKDVVGEDEYAAIVAYLFGVEGGEPCGPGILRDDVALGLLFRSVGDCAKVSLARAKLEEWRRKKEAAEEAKHDLQDVVICKSEAARVDGSSAEGYFEVPVVEDCNDCKSLSAILKDMKRAGFAGGEGPAEINLKLSMAGYLEGVPGAWRPTSRGVRQMGMVYYCPGEGKKDGKPWLMYRGDTAAAEFVLKGMLDSRDFSDDGSGACSVPEVFEWSKDAGAIRGMDEILEERAELYDLFLERADGIRSVSATIDGMLVEAGYLVDDGEMKRPTEKGVEDAGMVFYCYQGGNGEDLTSVGYRDIEKAEMVLRSLAGAEG